MSPRAKTVIPVDPVLPDAPPDNWVDRFAPPALRPWLKLGRFDRPIGHLAADAARLAGRGPGRGRCGAGGRTWSLLGASSLVGAALMRAAGCAYNDIVDRDIDAKVARTAGAADPVRPDQRQAGLGASWSAAAWSAWPSC